MLVKDIMETNVHYVNKDMSIEEIVNILYKTGVSGVPVVDNDMKIIGMVSEADLLQKEKEPRLPTYIDILGSIIYIEGVKRYEEELKKVVATKAEEIMTHNVHYVRVDDQAEKVAKIMVEGGVNRVPVVDKDDKLVGIISRHDMLKLLL